MEYGFDFFFVRSLRYRHAHYRTANKHGDDASIAARLHCRSIPRNFAGVLMWPRERRQFRLGGAKHLDCVVREARCKADPSTFRETLESTLQQEIARMRDLGASRDAIAAFQAAADVHFALCGTGEPLKDADSVAASSGNVDRKNR